MNGQPIYGALDFPGDPDHPFNGWRTEHFHLVAPRVGIAYRVNDKTVIRTGGGIYFLPSTTGFSEAPWGLSINQ